MQSDAASTFEAILMAEQRFAGLFDSEQQRSIISDNKNLRTVTEEDRPCLQFIRTTDFRETDKLISMKDRHKQIC